MKEKTTPSERDTVSRFYSALLNEIRNADYDARERSLLRSTRYYYGRYLDPGQRNYFIQTVIPYIADSISYFRLPERPRQRILDVGCGLGMQSLIFASFGATVVGVDVREDSVLLCRKRKAYYENELGVSLDVEFRHANFQECHPDDFGTSFDSLFSMSAFSYIAPFEKTVSIASSLLKNTASVFLFEANEHCLLARLRGRPSIPAPQATAEAFVRQGFNTDFLYGTCALPKPFWRNESMNRFLVQANDLLRRELALSFSYVLGTSRGRRPTA